MPELTAYKGNKTHNDGGTHLGYRNEDNRLVILCGVTTANRFQCRCSPWMQAKDTELTCRECYEKGKAMHDGG